MTAEGLRTTINKQLVRIFVFCVQILYGFIRIFIFQKNGFLRKQSSNTGLNLTKILFSPVITNFLYKNSFSLTEDTRVMTFCGCDPTPIKHFVSQSFPTGKYQCIWDCKIYKCDIFKLQKLKIIYLYFVAKKFIFPNSDRGCCSKLPHSSSLSHTQRGTVKFTFCDRKYLTGCDESSVKMSFSEKYQIGILVMVTFCYQL